MPPHLSRRHFNTSGAALLLQAGAPCALAQLPDHPPYKNPAAAIGVRVEDLLQRMTLAEKVAQMLCIWTDKARLQDADTHFDARKAAALLPDGIGSLARPSDRMGTKPPSGNPGAEADVLNRDALDTANYVNAAQRWAMEGTRLGIPLLLHEECLHGYAARDATCFPQAIALASSFDTELVRQVFGVCAQEMRARGANMALGPVVDVARDPRWGRIEETYGEDPHLCAEIGRAAVLGLQGESLALGRDKVFATLKHMTGHGQPENGTNVGPAAIPERTLREVFLLPFERIIKTTQVAAVMPSYNEIDGVPSHANRWMLTDVLRVEWGFRGVTVSDYGGINALIVRQKLAANASEAALRALDAGVDIETANAKIYPELAALVTGGQLAVEKIDAVVRRILRLKFEGGLFENPFVAAQQADALTATPDAVALARRAAQRSAVLLKNEGGLLPLDARRCGRLLVLGTHARDTPIGGYSDRPRHVVSILEGLQALGRTAGFSVAYSEGVRITEQRDWQADAVNFTDPAVNARLIAEAVKAAGEADTLILVLGDNEQTSREAWADNHLGDRAHLDLMGQQNDLARAIFDLGKPTIVFLLNGRPLAINVLQARANAIIEGWYLGQQTGHAAADLLFGRANPGGKLPVSFARHVGQLPVFYNAKPTARRGYLDSPTAPLYPFGFGLSYTTFDITAPRLLKPRIAVGEPAMLEVRVTNTGSRSGDEVVQVYVRDDVSSVTRPLLELKAFRRITLAAGASAWLHFTLAPDDLAFYDTSMRRVVEPGTFTISVGPNSVALKAVTLTVVPA